MFLCLMKYHTTKAYKGLEVYFHVLFISVRNGNQWWVLSSEIFTSFIFPIANNFSFGTGLDALGNTQIFFFFWKSKPTSSVFQCISWSLLRTISSSSSSSSSSCGGGGGGGSSSIIIISSSSSSSSSSSISSSNSSSNSNIWNVKEVIPVITGTTGTISKSSRK